MEFTPALEEAYQQSGYQTEFYWQERSRTGLSEDDRLRCQQQANELDEELTRELGPDTLEDRIIDDQQIQYLAGQRDANLAALKFDDKFKEHEIAVRAVVDDVADGLTIRGDFPFVSYTRTSMIGNDELNAIPSMSTVSNFVSSHPISETKGPGFSAEVSWRLTKFLTVEIIDQIISDDTRITPNILDDITDNSKTIVPGN